MEKGRNKIFISLLLVSLFLSVFSSKKIEKRSKTNEIESKISKSSFQTGKVSKLSHAEKSKNGKLQSGLCVLKKKNKADDPPTISHITFFEKAKYVGMFGKMLEVHFENKSTQKEKIKTLISELPENECIPTEEKEKTIWNLISEFYKENGCSLDNPENNKMLLNFEEPHSMIDFFEGKKEFPVKSDTSSFAQEIEIEDYPLRLCCAKNLHNNDASFLISLTKYVIKRKCEGAIVFPETWNLSRKVKTLFSRKNPHSNMKRAILHRK